jgi:hypothetical protein
MRLAEPQCEAVAAPVESLRVAGVTACRSWQKHVLTLLMVFGPGPMVMEQDNNAGAVSSRNSRGGKSR